MDLVSLTLVVVDVVVDVVLSVFVLVVTEKSRVIFDVVDVCSVVGVVVEDTWGEVVEFETSCDMSDRMEMG